MSVQPGQAHSFDGELHLNEQLAEVLRGSRQALRETNWSDGTAHDYSRLLEIVKKTSSELRNDPDTVRLIRAAEAWRKLSNR